MYGFCSNNALYSVSRSFAIFIFLLNLLNTWCCYNFESNLSFMWHMKVLLVKKECNVVLKSSNHEEISFPHWFIFVFTLYIIGVMLSKKCCRNWEVDSHIGDVVYRRGRFKAFALCPGSVVFIIVIGEWNFLRHFPFSNDYRTPLMRFCVGVLVLIRNWTVKTPSNFHYQVASLPFIIK